MSELRKMPIIELGSAICRLHWDTYAARWPRKVMSVFVLMMFQQLSADEVFAKACKIWRPEPEKWVLPEDFMEMNIQMRHQPFAPWCTYLGSDRMEAAWLETPYQMDAKES